jgi:hypothetical protein
MCYYYIGYLVRAARQVLERSGRSESLGSYASRWRPQGTAGPPAPHCTYPLGVCVCDFATSFLFKCALLGTDGQLRSGLGIRPELGDHLLR